jgi:hypothetical protein
VPTHVECPNPKTGRRRIVQAEYSFDLGGPSFATSTFTFRADAEVLPLSIARPLGIVFEEKVVDGVKMCVADEVLEGSNAAAAGVQVRSASLRACSCRTHMYPLLYTPS